MLPLRGTCGPPPRLLHVLRYTRTGRRMHLRATTVDEIAIAGVLASTEKRLAAMRRLAFHFSLPACYPAVSGLYPR